MRIILAILISVFSTLGCTVANNDAVSGINPDCNYAGICVAVFFFTACRCCAPAELDDTNDCGSFWSCDPNDVSNQCYEFSSHDCTEVEQYIIGNFGFRLEDNVVSSASNIDCYTDPYRRDTYGEYLSSDYTIEDQIQYILQVNGWPGTVKPQPICDTCSPAYPCTYGTDPDVNVTSGLTFGFQVDFNEYYNTSCGVDNFLYSLPENCDANYDYGQLAYVKWFLARGDVEGGDTSFIDDLNTLLWSDPSASNDNLGLSWNNTLVLAMAEEITKVALTDVILTAAPTFAPTTYPTEIPTSVPTTFPTTDPTPLPSQFPTSDPTPFPTDDPTPQPSQSPTSDPTRLPTESPTPHPTQIPTQGPTTQAHECGPYMNDVEDMVFKGVGSNCRAGFEDSWTGGKTCDSPYIICLPAENTPSTSGFGNIPYKAQDHRYMISECLEECAQDQRCLGAEWVADSNSVLGDCNIIDDIPLEITDPVAGFTYDSETVYTDLDSSVTGGDALCFEKEDSCYPYWEAGDLNEVMLNCYCPNNRKGFYTKKVKRTVANTRFCGSDSDVDLRIQKAQANRMFHLCENWCLFNTDDPESETWYWDPWKTCWREQYAGTGTHRSWCNRVIRSPDTIEMQFLNHRSGLFCQTGFPTMAPAVTNATWHLAGEEDSCDDACSAAGKTCDENGTADAYGTSDITNNFAEAGVTCASVVEGTVDWAFPGSDAGGTTCYTRNSATENTGCSWAIGVGYQRLCACW